MRRNGLIFKMYFFCLFVSMLFVATNSMAAQQTQTDSQKIESQIANRIHIDNIEATPQWFKMGEPVDFKVNIRYDGEAEENIDVFVYHENREVGSDTSNRRFQHGPNIFRLRDKNFKGDPGAYIVKVRHNNRDVVMRKFTTLFSSYTIDPAKARVEIVNLEASPQFFKPNIPIDFVVTINYNSESPDAYNVGLFHENREVAWSPDIRFNKGNNQVRLNDGNFRGDSGTYIVKVRFRSSVIVEKKFQTLRVLTLEPSGGEIHLVR